MACLGDHEGVCSVSTAAPAGELFVDRADGALNLLNGVNGSMVPNPGLDVVVLGAGLDPYRPGQKILPSIKASTTSCHTLGNVAGG